jgi:hypothetical protein
MEGVTIVNTNELHQRLAQLEQRTQTLERRALKWRRLALGAAVLAGVVFTSSVEASKAKKDIVLADLNTGAEAIIDANGITFLNNSETLMKLSADKGWSGLTVYGKAGSPASFIGTDDGKSTMRLYSGKTQKLLIETSESLLDAGSGIRLYDQQGAPRATLYAERRGEAGIEFTDANRQPRIDIYAKPGGVSVIRASDSSASSVAELSVLPESDAMVRYTGVVPEPTENEPLVPMIYLHDKAGQRVMRAPGFSE